MNIKIESIEYYLPQTIVTNDDLKLEHPEWDAGKIFEKTGVEQRYIAGEEETALDLAIKACEKLFEYTEVQEIDGIIFCTQTPDFLLPSNAFLIHKRFNFRKDVFAFDYNLACSGFIYGLILAKGFVLNKLAEKILLINADTYSKLINKRDKSTRVLFSDAAVATILKKSKSGIIDCALGSSGNDYESFFVPVGGFKKQKNVASRIELQDRNNNYRSQEDINMDGFAVWKFIQSEIPKQINDILEKNSLKLDDIDMFFFHQASLLTLNSIVKKMRLPNNKVFSNISNIGNTVSASIPILLKDAINSQIIRRNNLILLSGFGVGLSYGTIIMKF